MKLFLLLFSFIACFSWGQLIPQNGTVDSKPKYIAFKNARILVSPTKTIENGTILIEGDKIIEVGMLVFPPDDAIIVDCEGKTIIASFIETISSVGLPKHTVTSHSSRPQLESSKNGAYYWNESIHPEADASSLYQIDAKTNDVLLKMGFGLALAHVNDGIAQGSGALVSLGNENENKQIIKGQSAQFYSFEKGVSQQTYPSSQM